MHRTPTVTAMVQSSCGVITLVSVVLVIVLPVVQTSVYALEQPATVELLPNDLFSEDREQEATDKAIATPKQVIEHQVSKAWRTIIRQMLDETRTSIKHKRTLPNPTPNIVTLVALFMLCLNAGLFPQLSNPLAGLGGHVPDTSLVHSAPDTLTGGGLISGYAGGSVVSGMVPDMPVDAGHATGIVGAPADVVPSHAVPDLTPPNLGGGIAPPMGSYGL
ncbi:uncharacterized protein LOC126566010 [Anopheles maculipalpis]|uniref:uncharacterized protein LOC126566010 n=1 Tax=Anopheles maculipalpis TaxID=1496333 RepID=UPI00215923FC|nr:uncharacterized protein LOC126566010 [Anopheles maculipalpis]